MIEGIGNIAAMSAAGRLSRAAGPADAGGAAPSGGAAQSAGAGHVGKDFESTLKAAARETVRTLQQSEMTAISAIAGKADIRTVVDRVMAAERTLSATLAIRNKLIAAWQEISRMQI